MSTPCLCLEKNILESAYTLNLRVVIEDTEIAEDVVCNAGFVSSNTASHSLLWRAKSLLLGSLFSYSETP